MNILKKLLPLILFPTLLVGCGGGNKPVDPSTPSEPSVPSEPTYPTYTPAEKVTSDSLFVKKVENLPEDFIMGMDASSVIAEEASGVKYYNFKGEEEDVFKILADNGINYIRVRIWNDPYDKDGNGYGGGNNDIDKAVEIGKRATQYGMKLLVDFHYSDFWADPAKQQAPKAWANLLGAADYFELQDALVEFTKESLLKLKNNGVNVGMVQLGNETNGGKMAGVTRFDYFAGLVSAGNDAVKEIYPEALTAVHFANPEKTNNYLDWAAKLKKFGARYDVFGSSYYPYWHGTLDNLQYVLSEIASTYDKKVMVLETSYAFNTENTDFHNNTIGATSGYDTRPFPFTLAGQTNSVVSVIETMANTTNGIGVCYWEGTWITVGTSSWEENHEKWEKYGSGWASSYAAEYDPKDAGQWPGGCAVENQAFFDQYGKPLESLKLWALVREGNNAPRYVDGIEDVEVIHYTDEDFELPKTANVIYNDNSKAAVEVNWEAFDIPAAKAAGNANYVINGITVDGTPVRCLLKMMEFNFIDNYSFEDDDMSMWTLTNLSDKALDPNSYKAEVTNENVQTGEKAFAFWAKNANTCKFEIEQDITSNIRSGGTYKYQASFTGGTTSKADASKLNLYIYVKINGTLAYQKSGLITEWNSWHDALLEGIQVELGDNVVVGVHMESSEAGIWGSIEDCMFNYVG